MNKNIILWGLLIILLLANFWLLFNYIDLQQRLHTSEAENNIEVNTPPTLSSSEPLKFKKEGISKNMNEQFTLVAIFSEYGCLSCINDEIEFLNNWNDKAPSEVYIIGEKNNNFLSNYGAKFKYSTTSIENLNKRFNKSITISNPILLLVDSNDYVQLLHINDLADPVNDIRRDNFYSRVESLFNL